MEILHNSQSKIMASDFQGRLALQQRVLAAYRAPFFASLAQSCAGGLSVCAGLPRPGEAIAVTDQISSVQITTLTNDHFFKGSLYLCYQRGLIEWLADCSPNALIVEANPRYLSTPSGIHWMKSRKRPVLGWGLGTQAVIQPTLSLQYWLAKQRRNFRVSFLRSFDALITYSQSGAEEYGASGFPIEKIFVAPNAVAPRPAHPMLERRLVQTRKPGVLFIGRLQARKRLDLLIRACASLPETLQPNLVIVGDGPERGNLEALAKSAYPLVEFPGEKFGEELAPYFSSADLFVLPGTGGLAVQEAMAFGLPVIMGRGDGTNNELVREGNGWQVPPDDLSALRETLQRALSDISHLREMGRESFRIVSEEVNLQNMVKTFIKAVNSVI